MADTHGTPRPSSGPLVVSPTNPRYFTVARDPDEFIRLWRWEQFASYTVVAGQGDGEPEGSQP